MNDQDFIILLLMLVLSAVTSGLVSGAWFALAVVQFVRGHYRRYLRGRIEFVRAWCADLYGAMPPTREQNAAFMRALDEMEGDRAAARGEGDRG